MWKLFNKLFGWDYVYWENQVSHGISRVYTDGKGKPYFYRYRATKCIDTPSYYTNKKSWGYQLIWLTCDPSKYGCE